MRNLLAPILLCLFLVLPALAGPTEVLELLAPKEVKRGAKYTATVRLDKPAEAGGSKVILLPTHRLQVPDTVMVAEGETEAQFSFKVYKDQIRDWHFDRGTVFTTLFKGEMTEWAGPHVTR